MSSVPNWLWILVGILVIIVIIVLVGGSVKVHL